jgi:hypothetical protein
VHYLERRAAKQGCHGPLDKTDKALKNRRLLVRHEAVEALFILGEKVQQLVESKPFRAAINDYSWARIVNKLNLIFVLGVEKGGAIL